MMINERLYWKAVQYAEWRCHKDETLLMPKVLLGEYNRLLKIDAACKAAPTTTKETMSIKLVKAGEFNFIVHTDDEGTELVAGEVYFDAGYGAHLFAPRHPDDLDCHFDAADLLRISRILMDLDKVT